MLQLIRRNASAKRVRFHGKDVSMRVQSFGFCLAVLLAGVAPVQAQTQVAPEKEKAIRRLLDVMGTVKLTQQMTHQMMASFRQTMPGVPEDAWSRFEKKLDAQELIDQIIPVYDKHFNKEDIEALAAFYETPLGRKVVQTLPQISQESMAIGQEWGRRKAQEVIAEIQQEQGAPKKAATPAKAAPPANAAPPAKTASPAKAASTARP
jgi:hypothetical protein